MCIYFGATFLFFLYSIRVTVCVDLTDEELEEASRVIRAAAAKHIS